MKLVTFEIETLAGKISRIGVLGEEKIVDLKAVYAFYLKEARGIFSWKELAEAIVPPHMSKFIERGTMAIDETQLALKYFEKAGSPLVSKAGERMLYRFDEIRLMAPVPRPVSIRDCFTFEQHAKTGFAKHGMELPELWYQIPVHYRTSITNVAGPGDPIIWPSYTDQLDYELEFAICIGRQGENIPVEKAEEYIFGYTIFNDISARDIQSREMTLQHGPAKGKSFRNSNIMGPCLVTPEEIDANNLRMIAKINGEIWSEGNSKDMYFKFPQLIAYISKDDPLYPGEFICSGTVNTGCGSELDRWLRPGDVVELEVEGIGVLRNKVVRNR